MSTYAYTGRSAGGESVRGSMEADSPDGVAARLTQGGIIPIDIRAAAGGAAVRERAPTWGSSPGVSASASRARPT